MRWFSLLSLLFLVSCADKEIRKPVLLNTEPGYLIKLEKPVHQSKEIYSWEKNQKSSFPRITKEYFRCRGSTLNPPRVDQKPNGETIRYADCGGLERHSLPLRDGKENIYTILIDLLNHIQEKTGKRIVITCGHRCPDHNSYSDPSPENRASKHMIGAEVSFYVQGMENQPEAIIEEIFQYYLDSEKYRDLPDFRTFSRYDGNTNVSTKPWFNKEVLIKLFRAHEGRNFDNRHSYPYIAIQVRYDWDKKEKVTYSWELANRNYLRF